MTTKDIEGHMRSFIQFFLDTCILLLKNLSKLYVYYYTYIYPKIMKTHFFHKIKHDKFI